MKFPPGTISRRYLLSSDSAIWFNSEEFTVEYFNRFSFRSASIAATSPEEVPEPLNRRTGTFPAALSGALYVVHAIALNTQQMARHGLRAKTLLILKTRVHWVGGTRNHLSFRP